MLNKLLTFILLTCFIIVNCQQENVLNETISSENLDFEGSGSTGVDTKILFGNDIITSEELKNDMQNAGNAIMEYLNDITIEEVDGPVDVDSIDDNSSTLKLPSSWIEFLKTGAIID